MKKFNIYSFIFLLIIFSNSNFAQISNPSFEEWETVPFLNPTNWITYNFLSPSVLQSNDAQHGNYSARLEITELLGERFEPILQNFGFEQQINSRYSNLKLYYKSDFKNLASLGVYVTTWDTNMTSQQLLPSGFGEAEVTTSASNWTMLELPIEYYSTENTPKYLSIVFTLSDTSASVDLGSVGAFAQIDNITLDQITDVVKIDNVPQTFKLNQNYPNPFNPSTTFEYSIAKPSYVSLKVYDIIGNEVSELVNENQTAGTYRYTFDGRDLSSGAYFVKLNAGNYSFVRKIMLLK